MSDFRIDGSSVNLLQTPGTTGPQTKPPTGGKSFMETMKDSVAKVENMQQAADQSVTDLAVGRTQNLHDTMIRAEQAELSFKMLMAVRGKVIAAYHEVMRMSF